MNTGLGDEKVAVTLRSPSIETTHVCVPLQPAPVQPENVEPLDGAAVNVTWVGSGKDALQLLPHEIPTGELVTLPAPVVVTDSSYDTAGAQLIRSFWEPSPGSGVAGPPATGIVKSWLVPAPVMLLKRIVVASGDQAVPARRGRARRNGVAVVSSVWLLPSAFITYRSASTALPERGLLLKAIRSPVGDQEGPSSSWVGELVSCVIGPRPSAEATAMS